jgi:hypothetical protein
LLAARSRQIGNQDTLDGRSRATKRSFYKFRWGPGSTSLANSRPRSGGFFTRSSLFLHTLNSPVPSDARTLQPHPLTVSGRWESKPRPIIKTTGATSVCGPCTRRLPYFSHWRYESCLACVVVRRKNADRCHQSRCSGFAYSFLGWKHLFPVVFHVHNGPASGGCFVETLVETADVRLAVVGPLAIGVGVVHVETEAGATAGGGPLQHLEVAIGIAEGRDRPAADVLRLMPTGLPSLSSMKSICGRRIRTGLRSGRLKSFFFRVSATHSPETWALNDEFLEAANFTRPPRLWNEKLFRFAVAQVAYLGAHEKT